MSEKALYSTKTDEELAAAGKDAPRIDRKFIQHLLDRVVVRCHVVEDTCTTVAVALLDGKFTLATEISACVDPANFLRETGERIATSKARDAAVNKLWELVGFRLYAEMQALPLGVVPFDEPGATE